LGRAIAHAFAKEGCRIGWIARNPEALDAAKHECEQLRGVAGSIPTDVADAEMVERAAVRIEEELGPIDIWVNNAMVSVVAPVEETSPEKYKRVTEVLYLGFVYGTLSALERMLARNRGTIIQVGSGTTLDYGVRYEYMSALVDIRYANSNLSFAPDGTPSVFKTINFVPNTELPADITVKNTTFGVSTINLLENSAQSWYDAGYVNFRNALREA